MLSILIPIYNYDVRQFVKNLSDQSIELEFEVEIICLDDKSELSFLELNREVGNFENVLWMESDKNLGRSAIRNRLVEKARFENLLFLDCDGATISDSYLVNYTKHWNSYDVIYGGRVYNDEAPDDHDLYFHWYCGSIREAILVENRRLNPYKSFMTNNFLIRKTVYDSVKMDETLVGYGHEDTLFAQELKRAGFSIKHVYNPIEHVGLETLDRFIQKSENGLKNLKMLINQRRVDSSIRLAKYYLLLRRFGLIGILSYIVAFFESRIMRNLRGPAPNLLWFDLWKLSKLQRFK